ncbi:TetR/AcrR family transcriptional regulator [Nocardia sp. NBC_00508]|uniref:TetR/AcrR family transcriptional regulator n=1 Tax=Nocardia sp. NBC_00508 TaxID=2975992 RepID=UPI002E81EA46|nr:TetR/AcrR family transcriptional regulator [Nocardia sp. NBC_00508]WUD65683.1 TetR/AcrR family transcriptional regulator [Nocardia sp. NBC_00508]
MSQTRSVRRQERGKQRMAEILDAALALFGELGYEATSTNAIAARAGVSPGSLYQFFANKEAIAEALSTRLVESFRAAHSSAFDLGDVTELSLDELVDRMLDPIIAFNVANPGAKALFGNTDMPAGLAQRTKPLQDAVVGRVEAVIAARSPELSDTERRTSAIVAVQIVRAMMSAVVAADDPERAALIREAKRALRGYLAEIGPHAP